MGLLREDKSNKPDFTIIPYAALEALAFRFMQGAYKYERDNYLNATVEQIDTYRQSAVRHLHQYLDKQDDEDHLQAAFCNIAIIITLEKKYFDINTNPDR